MPQPSPLSPSLSLADQPLADFHGWEIVAKCADPACRPNRSIPVADVFAASPALTLGRMANALKCSHCRGRPTNVALRRRSSGGEMWQLVRGVPFWS